MTSRRASAERNDAMAEQSEMGNIDRLSEALNNIQNSLECTICLELMTDPTKTRCGHSFCKLCIGEVLQKRNASCPLCMKSLNRRNVSKDDHQQACIYKFEKLLIAIQTDSHIDILSYSKQPRNTKESCSFSDAGQSSRDSNQRKSSKEQPICQPKQSSNRQTNKLSTNRETVIDCDNPQDDLKAEISNKKSSFKTLSSPLRPAYENENAIYNSPNTKIYTWLHNFPNESDTSALIENEKPVERKVTPINQISDDDSKSDVIGEIYSDEVVEIRRTSQCRKQDTDHLDIREKDTYQITETRQFDKVEIDSAASGLKYKGCHARVRAKNSKDASKSSIKEISNEQGSSTTMDDQARRIAAVDASNTTTMTQHSSANWSRVIKFGKEMKRAKKRKVKKLNVSTEKNTNQLRIIGDVILSPSSKYNTVKVSTDHNTSRKDISNLLDSTSDRSNQKDTTRNSSDLMKTKTSETNTHDRTELFSKNKVDNSIGASPNFAMETSYITLEEGKSVHITNLDSDQVNQIIGLENSEENFQHFQNQRDEANAKSAMEYYDSSPSPRKRLTVLTPERLNKTIREDELIHDVTQIPTGDPSGLPAENRTPGPRENNDAERTSGESVSSRSPTPNKPRLSLRRKGIDDNKTADSPLFSQVSLSDRLSFERHKRNVDDRKSIDPPVSTNNSVFNRLTVVRRDLSLEMTDENQLRINRKTASANASLKRPIEIENNGENISGTTRQDKELVNNFVDGSTASKKLKSTKNPECGFPVKFMQLGTLNRVKRHKVKYFYEGTTKREQVIIDRTLIEHRDVSVCNMQQSISGSEMERHIANTSRNLVASSNPSNDTRDAINITMIENIRCVENSNANRAVSEDAGSCAASPTYGLSATSTPKKDVDRHLNQKKIERSSGIANRRPCRSNEDTAEESAHFLHKTPSANRSISRVPSSNSVKLLSPEKDSQLQFLAIDSPMSEHEQLKRATKSAIKGDNFPEVESPRFAASTSKAQEISVERVDKKRKRTRRLSDRELFEDESSDSGSDSNQRTIKLDTHNKLPKDARSSDGNKKRRLSSPDDQDEIILLEAKEQDARSRKFKRIISISSSDTESESTTHVAIRKMPDVKYLMGQDLDEDIRIRNIIDRWSDEHNAMQRKLIKESGNTQSSKSRCPTEEEKSASHRSSQRSNALGIQTRKNASQKSSAARESDMFESSSMFNSDNVDYILRQPVKSSAASKTSEKMMDVINDDIINRVLQIDRSRGDVDARRSPGHAPSQRGKDSGDYLLQDNFDEIIANVELPQSGDMIPCVDQSGRNLNRPLAEQKTSNCLAMTDEACGAMQETPTIPASSTNDIFEHCSYSARNVRRPSATNVISRNSDKENVVSYSQRKHEHTGDRGDEKDVTANVDEIDKDPCRKITLKQNISHEKERFLEERDVSIQSTGRFRIDDDKIQIIGNELKNNSSEQDTLMNITLQQAQLQRFEEFLFAPAIRDETKATRITSQDDPFREEPHTPRKRKQDSQNRNSASKEHSAEEDDVVENTPETKMKNRGTNVKTTEPRRNIAISYPSPISITAERTPNTSGFLNKRTTPKSGASTPMDRFEIHPLCQSTPKIACNSTVINRLDVFTDNKEIEPIASGSILLAKQVDSKENVRQQADRRELCFVCSGLMVAQTTIVKEFAMKYNARFANQFHPDVTHVIVKTSGEQNIAKSTLKFLQGIAHRKWIVSYRWIEDCIRQQRLLDEVPYEAITHLDGVNYFGPRDSRLRKMDLFEGFTFLCIEPYINVSLIQYQDLLLATGATVVKSLEALAKKGGIKGIVIQDNEHNDSVIEDWCRTAKAAPVLDDWIVECIGQYKLFKFIPYILSSQDYFAIGYPPELVEDEEYHDDGE